MSRRSDEVTVSAWQPWSASHDALPQSQNRPRWQSTPRQRPSKPQVRTSSASARASPTSRRPTRSSRRPPLPATIPRTTATRRREACPSCGQRSSRSPSAIRASSAPSRRCSSPTAASRPSTTRSRRCSTLATRCCCRRRTGRPIPSRSRSAAACRSWCRRRLRPGFRVTIDQLEAALTPRTKALVFVSPSNPSGAVYPPAEVEAIGRWAAAKGIWVVTDEIYEHLTYGDHVFSSMPVLVPELADRWVVVNGVAKTYAMTGWRVGWMIGPNDVVKAATNLQSHSTSNVADVSQRAAVAALNGDLERGRDDASRVRSPRPHDVRDAQRDPGCHRDRAPRCVLRVPVVRGSARPHDPRTHAATRRQSSASCCSTRSRSRSSRARRSEHRATRACRSRWATTTSSRASPGSRSS